MAKKRNRGKATPAKRTSPPTATSQTTDSPEAGPRPPAASFEFSHREELTYSSPFPPPSVLGEYDLILPGLAERIVAMAERQAAHRQGLEQQVISSNVVREKAGSVTGPIMFVAILLFAGYLAHLGFSEAAVISALGDLVAFMGLLGWNYKAGRTQLTKKREQAAPPPRHLIPPKKVSN